jgi:uncharacterized protein (DUF1786 family)
VKVLTVDIGTGTQDIFLFDSRLALENGLKLVLPSPTMMVHRRIQAATAARVPLALVGRQMGGGPSAWAAEAHARQGLATYATPEAALTLDDDRDKVAALGIRILDDEEIRALPEDVARINFQDFDLAAIRAVFASFGTSLADLDAVAVAVFDHGAAPRGISDRQFRFDYLDRRIRERNSLTAFAYLASDVPEIMSRMRAVAESAPELDCPMMVMDTAPAAVLGATFDPIVRSRERNLIVNIGNFHALAFRLAGGGIQGVFEHHTGEIDARKLAGLVHRLADGSLRNQDVFDDMGHGALVYGGTPFDMDALGASHDTRGLRPYFAVPFGDMMIAGCFGLLAATADLLPEAADAIRSSMEMQGAHGVAPWDVD